MRYLQAMVISNQGWKFSNRIILATFLIGIAGCKNICTDNVNYGLSGGSFYVLPNLDSIKIGDTIFLSCTIPIKLSYSNRPATDESRYSIDGASNLKTDIHLEVLLGQNLQAGAVDSFEIIAPYKGSLTDNLASPHIAKTIQFVKDDTSYVFESGFIPKKPGVYVITVADIFQGHKNCDYFSASIFCSNSDNHLHYLEDIYYDGLPIVPSDQQHDYCFKAY